jgi:hypothetical protein
MVTNYITKSYIKSGSGNPSRKPLVLYIKSHIYTKFNTPKNLPNPLHLALPVSTLSHSPEIRRIKKYAEKWSEATSINQKKTLHCFTVIFSFFLVTFMA